ncbi:hypothetical protein PsorP6_015702 [Peronosclerospora sorghi]|uniref:Uncharacterized protein n=1 Tax=Peronosclerospora sorghi TaxID=230839 RepID=A0ACC0WNP6_9STRA|nr:hypothetical protein PsorP6_015702 [Peronosclerospora sorghi]
MSAYNGVALPFGPDIDEACHAIHDACKGLGTNEAGLIAALGTKSATQRFLIARRYPELYHKELKDVLQHETSSDFGHLLQLLAQPLPEAEATILYKATKGLGTKEKRIYPIVMGRTNVELGMLKKTYYDMYGKDLGSVMDSDLRGDVKKAVLASLQAPLHDFDPAIHTPQRAKDDAEKLFKAGEGRMGTEEHDFINILVTSPPPHVRAINAAYVQERKHDLIHAVKHEFSGDAEKALLFLVRMVLEPLVLLSEVGFGTDENGLSAALVRYHIVQRDIEPVFKATYGKHLRDRIESEVSGEYGKLVLAVFDSPVP